jgi:hypothetical protein
MPDPRLISRAQRAATMLERAWDRWRAAHGLAAEPLPPVSSYVGYSIEEPWGRPRVVFGVDAADAEKLATLLQECAARQATALEEPPVPQQAVPQQAVPQQAVPQQAVPQQAMAGAGARIPAQGRSGELTETLEHRSDAAIESDLRADDDQADADYVPEDATADLAAGRDDASGPAVPDGRAADTAGSTLDEDDVPAGQDDLGTPDSSGDDPDDDEGQPSAAAEDQASGEPAVRYMPDAHKADGPGEAGHSVTDSMVAELAGWASGELPGQASARLAAWAAAAGTTPRSGLDTELRTGSSNAESVV